MNIKNVGLTILIMSVILLVGNGLYHLFVNLFFDNELSLIVRIGIFGIIIGVLILIYALVRERIKDKKNENF